MHLWNRLHQFADKVGLVVNFDDKRIHPMLDVMEKREAETGLLLCPCSFVPSITLDNHDRMIRCPCGSLTSDITVKGICHCGIFREKGVTDEIENT